MRHTREAEPLPKRSGDSEWFPRQWHHIVLKAKLDYFEKEIRGDLALARTARNPKRYECLMRALTEVAAAREELAHYPDGASLALAVYEACVLRQRPDVEDADRIHKGRQKGVAVSKQRQQAETAQRHAQIRAVIAAIRATADPPLTKTNAIRRYLRDYDPDWSSATDIERTKKITALSRRLRARKKERTLA